MERRGRLLVMTMNRPDARNAVNGVFGSDDAIEGSRAFAERRDPRWSGA